MTDTTIVHVHVTRRLAVVTHNGIARLYRLKAINPLELIAIYRQRGYKYSWLTPDTILLTKKATTLKGAKAA